MERRDIEIIAGTNMNVVGEVEKQYYDVLKILIDPELEGLKSRIQVLGWWPRFCLATWPSISRRKRITFTNAKWTRVTSRVIKPESARVTRSLKMRSNGLTRSRSIWRKCKTKRKNLRRKRMTFVTSLRGTSCKWIFMIRSPSKDWSKFKFGRKTRRTSWRKNTSNSKKSVKSWWQSICHFKINKNTGEMKSMRSEQLNVRSEKEQPTWHRWLSKSKHGMTERRRTMKKRKKNWTGPKIKKMRRRRKKRNLRSRWSNLIENFLTQQTSWSFRRKAEMSTWGKWPK